MSFIVNKEMPCSHCQFPNEVEVWSIINAQEDPELREILLGGELNMVECESCHQIFYAEHFLLYHDPQQELMAFVYPYEARSEREQYEEKTRIDFELGQAAENKTPLKYSPISLFGLDELLEILEWEQEAFLQSDVANFIAQDKGLKMKKLVPSFYRAHRLPPFLPEKIEQLEKILQENSRLDIYVKAHAYLQAHPQVKIEWV